MTMRTAAQSNALRRYRLSTATVAACAALLILLSQWSWLRYHVVRGLNDYMPHGECWLWNRQLVTMHVVSDFLIFVSYVAIAFTLTVIIDRCGDRVSYPLLWYGFAAFIVSCGFTHLMEVVNTFLPYYFLAGYIKIVCAVTSLGTAVALLKLAPRIKDLCAGEGEVRR